MTMTADAIKASSDILTYISAYVDLKKQGNVWQGLCPFHAENTPSFTVYVDTQTWKCFGCSAGGDVIAFAMKQHSVTFPEALKLLGGGASASDNGVTGKARLSAVPETPRPPPPKPAQKAATLKREPYKDMADYCECHLKVYPALLERAGATDTTFKGHPAIRFPHEDGIDRVRVLSGTGAKWQPVSATKGVRCFYGLEQALAIRAETNNPLTLCNGQTSVIVAQAQLIPALCQTDGETSTGLQAPLLARLKAALADDKRIILAYDNDDAGREMSDAVKAQLSGYEVAIVRFGLAKGFDLADFCALHKGRSYRLLQSLAATVDADARPVVSSVDMCKDFDQFLIGNARPIAGEMVEMPFKRLHQFGGFAALTSPGKLGAVFGESGGGKTTLLETFTDALLKEGYDALWYSPEWGEYENHWRRIQRWGGATYTQLRQHQRWKSQFQRRETSAKRSPLDDDILDKSLSINADIGKWGGRVHCFQNARWTQDILERMSTRLLDLRTEGRKIGWAVFDYVQLLRSQNDEKSRTMYETILGEIKDWAITHNIFVWVGTQVLKDVGRTRDSKSLIGKYDAQWVTPAPFNLILSVNRQRLPNTDQLNDQYSPKAWLNVAKNSDGEEGALQVMTDFKRLRWIDEPWALRLT